MVTVPRTSSTVTMKLLFSAVTEKLLFMLIEGDVPMATAGVDVIPRRAKSEATTASFFRPKILNANGFRPA